MLHKALATLIFIALILLAGLMIVSEKSLRSDSVYFLLQIFDGRWFHHDVPSIRLSNYLVQLPLVLTLKLIPNLELSFAREIYSASYVVFIYAFAFFFLSEYFRKRSLYSILALCVFFTTILPGNNLVLNIANETILWSLLLLKKYCDGRKNWSLNDVVALLFIIFSYETSPVVILGFMAIEIKQVKAAKDFKNTGVLWLGGALVFTVLNLVRMAVVEETRKMPHMELYFRSLLEFLKMPANYIHFLPCGVMAWLTLVRGIALRKVRFIEIILAIILTAYSLIIFQYGSTDSFSTAYFLRTISVPLALLLVVFALHVQLRRLELFLAFIVVAHGLIDARASLYHYEAWQTLKQKKEPGCIRIGDLEQDKLNILFKGGIFGHSVALESIVRLSPEPHALYYDQNSRLLLDEKLRCKRRDLTLYGPTRRLSLGHLIK
ncbi:MAG: hypothetical protein CME71_04285 [Halobacteriovorax sp.]|nr:hypothetical protein [Halobacteriovorax sp.]